MTRRVCLSCGERDFCVCDQPEDLAARLLFTVRPTDRALRGWGAGVRFADQAGDEPSNLDGLGGKL